MMPFNAFSISIILFSCWFAEPNIASGKKLTKEGFYKNDTALKPVVIEMFSSEGCSSCPPAAIVMDKIILKAAKQNKPVYLLDFHVDYWDHIGWKDVLAKPEFTTRQRHYGKTLGLIGIYTPQAILNGIKEMVGSDRKKINISIIEELKKNKQVKLNCHIYVDPTKKTLSVNYQVSDNCNNAVINFALVQTKVTHKILSGENRGETLAHRNAVLFFDQDMLLASNGLKSIPHTPDPLKEYSMLIYIQDKTTMEILAACPVNLYK
ncbi:MAG: DUF1223 domain-containing protein [Bacteroidia bacterium]|nr:DUF1223 domain-containing protein [Bacteroidia bacterium]